MSLPIRKQSKIEQWLEEKTKVIEATGWRRHGAKVGDLVRLHCEYDYTDDDLWMEIEGEERYITMVIENGATGCITQLLSGDRVKAQFDCTIGYFDDDEKYHEIDDWEDLDLDIVSDKELSKYSSWQPLLTLIKLKNKEPEKARQLRLPL